MKPSELGLKAPGPENRISYVLALEKASKDVGAEAAEQLFEANEERFKKLPEGAVIALAAALYDHCIAQIGAYEIYRHHSNFARLATASYMPSITM
jgi:hypothetical protein